MLAHSTHLLDAFDMSLYKALSFENGEVQKILDMTA